MPRTPLKPSTKRRWKYLLGFGLLLVMIVGSAAAFTLLQLNQDLRNQAASQVSCAFPAKPILASAYGDSKPDSAPGGPVVNTGKGTTKQIGGRAQQPEIRRRVIACECPDGSRVAPGQKCRTKGTPVPSPSLRPKPTPIPSPSLRPSPVIEPSRWPTPKPSPSLRPSSMPSPVMSAYPRPTSYPTQPQVLPNP